MLKINLWCATLYHLVLVTVGFNQTTYSVREDAGSVTVSVSVISGTVTADEIITLSTAASGTAKGGIITKTFVQHMLVRRSIVALSIIGYPLYM